MVPASSMSVPVIFHSVNFLRFVRFLAIVIAFLAFGNCTSFGEVYYVDDNSAPGGSGLSSSLSGDDRAWATLAEINQTVLRPGDTVLFKRGGLWRGTLVIPASGLENNPIRFSAYGDGPRPIIAATRMCLDTDWAGPDDGGRYWIAGSSKARILLMDGRRLDRGRPGSLNAYSWAYSAGKILLKLPPDDHPRNHIFEIGARNHSLVITGKHHLVIDDLTFVGGNNREHPHSSAGTVKINGASSAVTLKNCVIKAGFFSGIGIEEGSHHIVIQECDIFGHSGTGIDIRGAGTKNIHIKNNKIHNIAELPSDAAAGGDKGGITVTRHHGSASDCLIEGNEIFDNSSGASTLAKCVYGISIYEAGGNVVRYNKIYNNFGGGLYIIAIKANARNNQVYYNLFWNNGNAYYPEQLNMGIRIGGSKSADASGTLIANNVLYQNNLRKGTGAIHVGGHSGKVSIINNICYANDAEGFELFYSQRRNRAKIINNCLYRSNGNILWYGGRVFDLESLNSKGNGIKAGGSIAEIFSFFSDPGLQNPQALNFRLKKNSPCVDQGIDIGLRADFNGVMITNQPDIGAFEYGD